MAAFQPRSSRGTVLLFQHCTALARLDDGQPSATARLERLLGGDFARFLVGALTAGRGRASSLAA